MFARARCLKRTLSDETSDIVCSEVFLKFNCSFGDTLILQIYFLIIEINNFRGDLGNILAETASLIVWCWYVAVRTWL